MIRLFTLDGIQKKAAVFDATKLEWMNGQYLSALPAEELLPAVRRRLEQMGVSAGGRDLRPLIDAVKARSRTILHVADQVAVRLDPSRSQLDEKGEALIRKMGSGLLRQSPRAADALEALRNGAWTAERLLASSQGHGGDQRPQAGRRDAADPGRADRVDGVRAGERAARGGRGRSGAWRGCARWPTARERLTARVIRPVRPGDRRRGRSLACAKSPAPRPAPRPRADSAPPPPSPVPLPSPARARRASPRRAGSRRSGHALPSSGDINLGTLTIPAGVPPEQGRGLLDAARPALTGDLVVGNFEGVLGDSGTTYKCGRQGTARHARRHRSAQARAGENRRLVPRSRAPSRAAPRLCYAFLTPTALAPRLAEGGFTHLNLANNHANDFGAGRPSRPPSGSSTRSASAPTGRSGASRWTRCGAATALTTVAWSASPPIPTPTICSTSRAAPRWWIRSGAWWIC